MQYYPGATLHMHACSCKLTFACVSILSCHEWLSAYMHQVLHAHVLLKRDVHMCKCLTTRIL